MGKKKRVVMLLACCLFAGCAINAPRYKALGPADSKDGLIVIERFDLSHAEKNTYKGKSDFGKILAEYLAGALQENKFLAVVNEQQEQSSGKYRITGEIIGLEQGNWQGRFWVAPGVGMAHVTAEVRLIRVSDNVELCRVKDSVFSTTAQSTETILRRICAKVSRELAQKLSGTLNSERM